MGSFCERNCELRRGFWVLGHSVGYPRGLEYGCGWVWSTLHKNITFDTFCISFHAVLSHTFRIELKTSWRPFLFMALWFLHLFYAFKLLKIWDASRPSTWLSKQKQKFERTGNFKPYISGFWVLPSLCVSSRMFREIGFIFMTKNIMTKKLKTCLGANVMRSYEIGHVPNCICLKVSSPTPDISNYAIYLSSRLEFILMLYWISLHKMFVRHCRNGKVIIRSLKSIK